MASVAMKVLYLGVAASLAMGVAGCDRQPASGQAGVSASATAGTPPGQVAPSGQAPQQVAAAGTPQYAQVLSVTPIRQVDPQRVCHDEVVTRHVQPQDQHRIAGTAIGAVAGGLLGHLVGGGKGNTVATVAGAVGGGYAGNRIEQNEQQNHVVQETVQRCQTVEAANGPIVAYDVNYVFNGVTRTTRMDHDPGDRLEMQ